MSALTMRDHQRAYDNQSPPEDGTPRCERIADQLGLHYTHWLVTTLDDVLDSGDAIYLLSQCKKHLAPRCPR